MRLKSKLTICSLAVALAGVTPALAQTAIPGPIEAMIRHVATTGDAASTKAVVEAAKATNPDAAAAIDALAGTLLAQAQAKAEAEKQAKLASQGFLEGWSGQGEVGLSSTGGNTKDTGAIVGIGLKKEGLKTRHKVGAVADYQRSNGTTTRQKYALDYAFNYKFNQRLYAYGLVGWDKDKFGGITRRFTQSAGIGYRVIDAADMTLDLEAGPALRQTKFTSGLSENKFVARGSVAYRWMLTDTLIFTQDASALWGSGNSTFLSTTALSAKLSDALAARLSFGLKYESEPPLGLKKTDTATRLSIVYGF